MKNKLTYFISSSSMFGIGFFLLFKNASKDAWISLILGTMLGIIILFIYSKIKECLKDNNLKETLKNSYLGKFYLFIFFLFYLYLITIILILLPMFVNSFYLLYTPKIIVILPFLFLAIYLTYKEKRVLETLSNLLFVISIFTIIIYIFALIKYIDFKAITPILSNNSKGIIKASLIYASITTIPNIITLNFNNYNFKYELKVYLISSLMLFLITLSTILCLGEPLIRIYSFPEYAVLKQIKILDFIENIENLSTFIWYFDMFITLSTLTFNVKEILPHKYKSIYYYLAIFITIILSIFIVGSNYRFIITVFYSYPLVLFIFFLLFITLFFYLKKIRKD